MRTHQYVLLGVLLAVALASLIASGAPAGETDSAAPTAELRAKFAPAKLFDFDNFKQLFKKTYSGILEELVRKKYFLSRAFRAFISSIKYRYRKSRLFLAVNEMSDWTQEEEARSENKVLAERSAQSVQLAEVPAREESESELPELLPADADEAERELKKLAETSESEFHAKPMKLRELPVEKLIDTGAGVALSAEAAKKLKSNVESNNPEYRAPDLASFGLADEQRDVKYWVVNKPPKVSVQNTVNAFGKALSYVWSGVQEEPVAKSAELPDEVFLDLRLTNCLTIPRQQGACGSCYAFAAITLFEFYYCMKTGDLVPFSEQYMVDCGNAHVNGISGCQGGHEFGVGQFVANFGLELRNKYPYFTRENQCPYEDDLNPKQTGYIRFDYTDSVQIPVEAWPEYLKSGPLWIGISTQGGFREYGGGIFGEGCDQERATHAVVVVGHGREDGVEYWIIRNSHSIGWGDGGYGKMAKDANCIHPAAGYAYATRDGKRITDRVKVNRRNDKTVVDNYYVKHMLLA